MQSDDKFNTNHFYIVKSAQSIVELFKNIVSKDKIFYPIFDKDGYVHIVIWVTKDGRYRIHNVNKMNNKDRLFVDVKIHITDTCYFIYKHEHHDNLYSFRSKHIPDCIYFYIEINETHIKKTCIVRQIDIDPFKKTTWCRLEQLQEITNSEHDTEEEIIKPKRKRKVKN